MTPEVPKFITMFATVSHKTEHTHTHTHTHTRTRTHTLSLSMALQPFEPWTYFQFLNLYSAGRTPWTGNQNVVRPLLTHRTQTQIKRAQTSMPRVAFEHTTPVFEQAKTVHALDRGATVIGSTQNTPR
jgi:hypothetical protein